MMGNRLAGVCAAVLLLPAVLSGCGRGPAAAEEPDAAVPAGYIDLEDYGGYASDREDDTEAFRAALASGGNIYLRKGEYRIRDTLVLHGQNLVGCGGESTTILLDCEDVTKPVVKMDGLCLVQDVKLGFEESRITGKEKQGERVGIQLGAGNAVARGSQIRNVSIAYVGTGVYSPNEANSGASGLMMDTMTICIYTYRGVDFQKTGQYGNLLSNIYIGRVKTLTPFSDVAFAVEGGETNLQVDQLNIEGTPVHTNLLLRNCRNAQFGSVHMEAVTLAEPGGALVKIENSTVNLDGLTAYYIQANQADCALLELGDMQEDGGDYVQIGTLHFKGFDSGNAGFKSTNGRSFKMVRRAKGAGGVYTFRLDRYVWYTWLGDEASYEAFPCDEQGIEYLSQGNGMEGR